MTMHIRNTLGTMLFCALFGASAAVAAEREHPLTMWQVEGQENRVYILGSIHLLREADHPLPSAIYDAYDDADTLIMELDMDDIDPVETQSMVVELGLIQGGETLSDVLGEKLYAEAETLAEAVGIPLSMMSRAEPWYAAMNIELMLLMRIGFNPMFEKKSWAWKRCGNNSDSWTVCPRMRNRKCSCRLCLMRTNWMR